VKVKRENKSYVLQGGEAWNEIRFKQLKEMNPKGKIVLIDEKHEKYLVPIGECEIQEEPLNY